MTTVPYTPEAEEHARTLRPYGERDNAYYQRSVNRMRVIPMETKSRYEVLSELEANKRELLKSKQQLGEKLLAKKKQLKELNRQVEDHEDDIIEFEESMESKKADIDALIQTVDEGIKRFTAMGQKS